MGSKEAYQMEQLDEVKMIILGGSIDETSMLYFSRINGGS